MRFSSRRPLGAGRGRGLSRRPVGLPRGERASTRGGDGRLRGGTLLHKLGRGMDGGRRPLRLEDTEKAARLEAVLLLAREPLSTRRLAQLADLEDATEARTLVRRLNQELDEHGAAFRVEMVAGGCRLFTRPQYYPWLRRLHTERLELRLSPPAMETLAVVAYRQPVVRAAVEAIRGVQCGEILRQLMERDLVRIVGKADELGRPFLYGTTRKFLESFGLRDLEELPRADLLRRAGAGSEVADVPAPSGEGPVDADIFSPVKESEVKVSFTPSAFPAPSALEDELLPLIQGADEEFEEDEDEDEDDEEEDEDDDLEDEEWEEVDDEEFEEEEEDLEEEDDEEWDEEDDEEWDEEDDEEWDEEDDEEWDEDEEEEEEEDE